MKTKIMVTPGGEILAEYDFLITMSKGDWVVIDKHSIDYQVYLINLNIEENTMYIIVKSQ